MKTKDYIAQRIAEAEKRIQELLKANDIKKITETEAYRVSEFYLQKSINRIQTAKIILKESLNKENNYTDFGEAVSTSYYSMYYIIHCFIALKYRVKLREGVRGIHAITIHLLLYYLIKTNLLARHFYEEYRKNLDAAAQIQAFNPEEYQEESYKYAQDYEQQRTDREIFTYSISRTAAENHAQHSIQIAEEFITTLRQLLKK